MSILDDAIREHLELKRQHGAPADELKKLEDEAFGPPARPDEEADPFAEAPTEFMTAPAAVEAPAPADAEQDTGGRRAPNIADLQEAPPAPAPAEEEHPAMEHEAIADLPPAEEPEPPAEPQESAGSHTTEERHAIAEQPTEMFDVESELGPAEAPVPAEEAAPSDEELADAELAEPRLAPSPATDEHEFDDEDDFFSEQRLSDELDQALEAPAQPAEEVEEDEVEAVEEIEEDEPVSEEYDSLPAAEDPPLPTASEEGHEDVLEDTPDFLEESPEDDQLWFEQKPPKDFDFDD